MSDEQGFQAGCFACKTLADENTRLVSTLAREHERGAELREHIKVLEANWLAEEQRCAVEQERSKALEAALRWIADEYADMGAGMTARAALESK